jgi:hypothetical protein
VGEFPKTSKEEATKHIDESSWYYLLPKGCGVESKVVFLILFLQLTAQYPLVMSFAPRIKDNNAQNSF